MLDLIKNRVSVKNYTQKEVSAELLEKIIEAGVWAPSGRNRQAVSFLVVTDPEIIKTLERLNAEAIDMPQGSTPFYGAPVLVSVFGDRDVHTHVEDASLALGNMMNVAYSLEVDSCWIHRAREMYETEEGREIARAAGIPDSYIGVGNCILGYRAPTHNPVPKERVQGRVYYIK